MAIGDYDKHVFKALKETGVLREGAVIWDIGANIGYDSLMSAALTGKTGRVVAFEPNPHNVKWLQQHLDKNPKLSGRIATKNCAVSDFDGQQVFRFSPLPSLSSIGYLDELGPPSDRIARSLYENMPTVAVRVAQVDTLIQDGTPVPDCMKIDVEGAEIRVLQGAQRLLREHRPVLAIEVHNIQLMFEVQEMLFNYGYRTQYLADIQHPSSSRGFVIAVPQVS
jgi:FkbM family methyltransferase